MRRVYFVRPVGMRGPIKIGCSDAPEHRLKTLMAWAPWPLEIVAMIPGNYDLERNVQDCFAHLHTHSEWFLPGDDLCRAVDRIAAGEPIERAVDLSKRRGNVRSKSHRPWTEDRRLRVSYHTRLSKAMSRLDTGDSYCPTPDDVRTIMDRWSGRPYRYGAPIEQITPSAEQIDRLEQFLADPEPQCERRFRRQVA